MKNIHCLFTYEGEVKVSKGSISASNLLCEPLEFAFNDTGLPIVTATFTVTAGVKSVPIDNPQNIKGMFSLIHLLYPHKTNGCGVYWN